MCRFINADGIIQTGQGMLDKNMFAYCENNPINRLDENGDSWKSLKNAIINKYSALIRFVNNLFPKTQVAKSGGAEHKKKGTKGKHNKGKHESGQARKKRDAGGEKGDKRRTPNPNKKKFEPNNTILEKTIYCLAIVAVTTVIVYIAANDATIIGVLDDTLIAPLSAILWEFSNKVVT